jgi:methylenetetrahydrofolate dehydrogenase (NADP+)/methenyltetrahydrofolate cyclohydrolase
VTAATIIDGKAVAARVRADVADAVRSMDVAPGLATVLVGDDPASQIYVGGKHKACAEVGITSIRHDLPADTSEADVLDLIADLNADPAVSGMIVQLPVPDHIDAARVTSAVDPAKDVDGLTPTNAGLLVQGRDGLVPATPSGVMELLRTYDTQLEGAHAVVVGRSDLVGKPVASLLLAQNATVTICHSRTRDLGEVCRRADVLVAAVGRPRLVTGDVHFDSVAPKARAITPVPGGVGPMTIAMLLRNTLKAASAQRQTAIR